MTKTFSITLGAMAPDLIEQLNSQDIFVEGQQKKDIEHLQGDVDALHRLYVKGILPDSVVGQARKKLMKRITAVLKKLTVTAK